MPSTSRPSRAWRGTEKSTQSWVAGDPSGFMAQAALVGA